MNLLIIFLALSLAPTPHCNGMSRNHIVTINQSSAGERDHLVLQGDPTKVCTGDTIEWVAGPRLLNDFSVTFSDVPPPAFSVVFNFPTDYKITVTQTGDEDWYKYTITSGTLVLDPHVIIMGPG